MSGFRIFMVTLVFAFTLVFCAFEVSFVRHCRKSEYSKMGRAEACLLYGACVLALSLSSYSVYMAITR